MIDSGLGHIPCFAHTLNLVVKGSIEKTQGLSALFQKCHECVTFFRKSSVATSKLNEECAKIPELGKSRLAQDVETRWNSTVTMLCSMMTLKDPVLAVLDLMQRNDLAIGEQNWETIAAAVGLLVPFLQVTEELSSQEYPSISKVICFKKCNFSISFKCYILGDSGCPST